MKAVNLIPSDQRRGQSVGAGRSEGGAYAVLGLLAAIAVMAFLYGHAKHQASSRESQAAGLTSKAQSLQAEVSRLSPYTSFISLHEARAKAVASLVDSRFDWAHAFHEFGRVLPSNISISSLTGTIAATETSTSSTATPSTTTSSSSSSSSSAGSSTSATPAATSTPVTSATPPGSIPTFTITGCGTSQRAVANMLQRLRLIDGAAEVTLQSSSKGGGGASSASGGCSGKQPSFTATITFEPLPSEAETEAAVKGHSSSSTVSNPTSAGTTSNGATQ